MRAIIFRPAAAADVEDAYHWYENQRKGMGDQFLDAVSACVEAVQQHPERFPVLHRDTRRALLRRFPYGLFYRIHVDMLIVVACFHGKRNPRVWRTRRWSRWLTRRIWTPPARGTPSPGE